MIIAAERDGPSTVAWIVILVNGAYTIGNLSLMHGALLAGGRVRWYVEDVGYPLAVSLLIAGVGRWLFPATLSRPLTLAALVAVALARRLSESYV